jgi:hypothetical protein
MSLKPYDDAADRLPDDDPLAFFRSARTPTVATREVDDMKRAVAELRRVRTLEASSSRALPGSRLSRRRLWAVAAAVAAALVLTLSFGGGAGLPDPAAVPALATVAVPALDAELTRLALVEDYGAGHELIQIEDDQLSLVIVVPQE